MMGQGLGPRDGSGLAGQQAGVPEAAIQEVMQMLMEGATPEQLVQSGVPVEVVEQAIAMLQQMQAQQQPQPEGLAGQVL